MVTDLTQILIILPAPSSHLKLAGGEIRGQAGVGGGGLLVRTSGGAPVSRIITDSI